MLNQTTLHIGTKRRCRHNSLNFRAAGWWQGPQSPHALMSAFQRAGTETRIDLFSKFDRALLRRFTLGRKALKLPVEKPSARSIRTYWDQAEAEYTKYLG